MARLTKKQQARRRLFRRVMLGTTLLGIGVLVVLAWRWQHTLPLRAVAVDGFARADSAEIVRLAALPDSARLFSLDPDLVADRVRRAPWVADARVQRRPTGTLAIHVEERTPVALVLGADSRPGHFLDSEGYSLPLRAGDPFDVPVLRGRVPAYHPTQPVQSASLRDLLAALAAVDDEADALLSELVVQQDGVLLRTTPYGEGGALAVRLGAGGYAEKLQRLRAFWDAAVLPRPKVQYRSVDLRFDGQVITREQQPSARPPRTVDG